MTQTLLPLLHPVVLACTSCAQSHGEYDPRLVALSVVIAIVAAYTALDLGGRVATNSVLARRVWLVSGAVMMGIGIWSMHFVGMLAFIMPMPVAYEPGRTIASMLVAMAASGLALFLVSRSVLTPKRLVLGGLVMGSGIASMHYLGMAAMQMQAKITYRPGLVALSELIAVAASMAALALAFSLRWDDRPRLLAKGAGAVLMGVAIAGMHYTGMAAARFEPIAEERLGELQGFEVGQLGAAAIGGGTLLALGLTLLSSLVDLERRRAQQTLRFLAEASIELGRLLEPRAVLSRAADLAVIRLCDWCVVDMSVDGVFERVAIAATDGSREVAAFELPPSSPALHGRSELVEEITAEQLAAQGESEAFRRFLQHERIRSYLRVPLVEETAPACIVTFFARAPRKFGPVDVDVARDFARRVAVALEAAHLFRQAEDAIRLRDEFLSVASHELRTPLTSLKLQLETLSRRLPVSDDARLPRSLASANRSTDRLAQLIDDLLDVSRITAGRIHLRPEPFDLAQLAREVVELHREQFESAGSRIRLEVQPTEGRWDRFRLEQVLTNLLSNAVKYGNRGEIAVRVHPNSQDALIEVEDHGIGIRPEQLAKVFDRFERAVSSQHYPGLGLGLYITRQIVEAHGGTIGVRSEPGHGSTFTVHLPREESAGG